MKSVRIACVMLIAAAAGLSFNAAAEQTLRPMQAYTVEDGDHLAVLYYTAVAGGYQVVATWVTSGSDGVLSRNTVFLRPGQRYALSLQPAGLPARLELRGDARGVAMNVAHGARVACAGSGVAQAGHSGQDRRHAALSQSAMTVVDNGALIRLKQ